MNILWTNKNLNFIFIWVTDFSDLEGYAKEMGIGLWLLVSFKEILSCYL